MHHPLVLRTRTQSKHKHPSAIANFTPSNPPSNSPNQNNTTTTSLYLPGNPVLPPPPAPLPPLPLPRPPTHPPRPPCASALSLFRSSSPQNSSSLSSCSLRKVSALFTRLTSGTRGCRSSSLIHLACAPKAQQTTLSPSGGCARPLGQNPAR